MGKVSATAIKELPLEASFEVSCCHYHGKQEDQVLSKIHHHEVFADSLQISSWC